MANLVANVGTELKASVPVRRFAWPTCGGLQHWGDLHLFRDWRIQQHVYRKVCRLLDGQNRCHATGTESECRAALERIRRDRGLTAWTGPSVLLLHGLFRTRYSMSLLGRSLRQAGWNVYNFSYPTLCQPIEQHAQLFRGVLEGLGDASELNLVGYSLGGIVIRTALAEQIPSHIRRCVMIGTPNQGACKADRWNDWRLFHWLLGPSATQLMTLPHGIVHQLPTTLPLEFGVIAGGTETERGYYPWLKEDNDFTVTVASTRLPGATDFALLRCSHAYLPFHSQVHAMTDRYLREGCFRSAAERKPIQ